MSDLTPCPPLPMFNIKPQMYFTYSLSLALSSSDKHTPKDMELESGKGITIVSSDPTASYTYSP